MYEFVCTIKYYPNCRGHEEVYYNTLKFFNNFKAVLNYAIENIEEYEIVDFYTTSGTLMGKFTYEVPSHNCTSIIFKNTAGALKTMDKGNGKLTWEWYDEKKQGKI